VRQSRRIVNRDRDDRERTFWDEHVPSLESCLREYQAGPDVMTAALLDALEPLDGARVLDFACGTGVVSAWLAARGATVTGLDLSPGAVSRARELAEASGLDITFSSELLDSSTFGSASFDRVTGRFALHHVDCAIVAPALARVLRPGGTGAFLETMDANPFLRFARRRLIGRFGIPRLGTLDEHPLSREDLRVIRDAFGKLEASTPQMAFLRIFDRQVLRYRSRRASGILAATDDLLERAGLGSWSYQQIVAVTRTNAG
jgi:SAM-dependent methyltransferase